MVAQARASSRTSRRRRRRSRGGGQRGQGIDRLAGRRALHVPRLPRVPAGAGLEPTADDEDILRPVAGSGLGILRDLGAADEHKSSAFGRLSGPVKAKAREKSLLVLAKANSKGDRPPPRLPRLRRRQGLRRRRRGRRRAPVPRPAVERCLHRVGPPGAPGARQGRRSAGADRSRPAQPRRQRAAATRLRAIRATSCSTPPSRSSRPSPRPRCRPVSGAPYACSSAATPMAATCPCCSTCRATATTRASARSSCGSWPT